MRTNTVAYSISSIRADIYTGKITFNHKLQRKIDQWTTHQKSLLIDSILKNYIIGDPVIAIDPYDRQYVIDGVQRLSTIHTFMNDGFRLSRNLDPVLLTIFDDDGTPRKVLFEIAGKKYSKLDDEVKRAINRYQIPVKEVSNYTEQELKEMFIRLNNATPMNKTQKTVVLFEDELYAQVSNALDKNFWTCAGITPGDVRKDYDRQVLLQVLYSIYSGKDNKGFKQPVIDGFIKALQEGEQEVSHRRIVELFSKMCDITDVLQETWRTPVPHINKISIPCIVSAAMAIKDNPEMLKKYAKEVWNFFENQYTGSEYEQVCHGSGTADAVNVNKRIAFFEEIVNCVKNDKEFIAKRAELSA